METPLRFLAVNNEKISLEALPAELIVGIFSQLPSFSDVFALDSTCHHFHEIWSNNASPIYNRVAPRCIPCERYARSLFADQGGPAAKGATNLSTKDIARLVRNARAVEKAIILFERHPLRLTRTERLRFTRSYYQLWGFMKLDNAQQQESRMGSMTLKQLLHLYEMSKLQQNIGGEEVVVPPSFKFKETSYDPVYGLRYHRPPNRRVLEESIFTYIGYAHNGEHRRKLARVCMLFKERGNMPSVFILDSWQPNLKRLICGYRPRSRIPIREFENKELWDDSSDDELYA